MSRSASALSLFCVCAFLFLCVQRKKSGEKYIKHHQHAAVMEPAFSLLGHLQLSALVSLWFPQPLGMEITTTSSVYPMLLLDEKSSALIDNLQEEIQAVFQSETLTYKKTEMVM